MSASPLIMLLGGACFWLNFNSLDKAAVFIACAGIVLLSWAAFVIYRLRLRS
jgi:hypothetical protein